MSIIKSIVEKLKLKELFAIVLISSLIITFMPNEWAQKMKIDSFKCTYQTYISLCIIAICAYYTLNFVLWIKDFVWKKTHSWKRIAIDYMKKNMSPDEMWLIIEAFYDNRNKRFSSCGKIDYSDGRKAPLENKHIIYLASQMGNILDGFAYNLQPYAVEFLNKNLANGNIKIEGDRLTYLLK